MAKVYLDMDGVLADFFGRWEEIIGCSYKEINSAEQFSIAADKFIKGTDFFYTLKPFDHSKSLTEIVFQIFGNKPNILIEHQLFSIKQISPYGELVNLVFNLKKDNLDFKDKYNSLKYGICYYLK